MNCRPPARICLFGIIAAALATWTILLPQIAQIDSVQKRVQRYREAGIETGAVFYSDHPAMKDIERRIDGLVNGKETAFWEFPSGQ